METPTVKDILATLDQAAEEGADLFRGKSRHRDVCLANAGAENSNAESDSLNLSPPACGSGAVRLPLLILKITIQSRGGPKYFIILSGIDTVVVILSDWRDIYIISVKKTNKGHL